MIRHDFEGIACFYYSQQTYNMVLRRRKDINSFRNMHCCDVAIEIDTGKILKNRDGVLTLSTNADNMLTMLINQEPMRYGSVDVLSSVEFPSVVKLLTTKASQLVVNCDLSNVKVLEVKHLCYDREAIDYILLRYPNITVFEFGK